MLRRYKQQPEMNKKTLAWILGIGIPVAAVLIIVLVVMYVPAVNGGTPTPKTFSQAYTGTAIDFESDSYKSYLTIPYNVESPTIVDKDGSKVLSLSGSGFYTFDMPDITTSTLVGLKFGFTYYKGPDFNAFTVLLGYYDAGYAGAWIAFNSQPYEGRVSVLHAVEGGGGTPMPMYENMTLFSLKETEKNVIEFTVESSTSVSLKINGNTMLNPQNSFTKIFNVRDISKLDVIQFNLSGNEPEESVGYVDNVFVSWR